jgi:membrane fusion protein (multidrug efflux system)
VKISDYQRVHAGDLLVELQDEDYQAQLAQATAAVEAAKAAIENNRRQRELRDSRIERALAGIGDLSNLLRTARELPTDAQHDTYRLFEANWTTFQ